MSQRRASGGLMRSKSRQSIPSPGKPRPPSTQSSWWKESDPVALHSTGLTFRMKLLGMQVVTNPDDGVGCLKALKQLENAHVGPKHHVLLTVTPRIVHVVQYPWKLACEHAVENISYCGIDPQNQRLFAYIIRDEESGNHVCICFKAFRNMHMTGQRLVEAFTYCFSYCKLYKDVQESDTCKPQDLNAVLSTDVKLKPEPSSCRYRGLPHFHSRLFTGLSETSALQECCEIKPDYNRSGMRHAISSWAHVCFPKRSGMTEQPSSKSYISNPATSASQLSVDLATCLPCAPSPEMMPRLLSTDCKLCLTEKPYSDSIPCKHSYPRLEPRMNSPPPPPGHADDHLQKYKSILVVNEPSCKCEIKGVRRHECCKLKTRKIVPESNPDNYLKKVSESILQNTASRNKNCGVSRPPNVIEVPQMKHQGKPPFLTPRAFPPPPPPLQPSPPPPPPPHRRPPGQHLAMATTSSDHSIGENKLMYNGVSEREASTLQQKRSCQNTTAVLPVQNSSCTNRCCTEKNGDQRVYYCLLDLIQANLSCWPVKDLPLFRFITLLFLTALHQ